MIHGLFGSMAAKSSVGRGNRQEDILEKSESIGVSSRGLQGDGKCFK